MNIKIQKGFTLIEVMIVVAIVAIIAAIALPSYNQYVRKAKRTDAKVELLRIAQLQESYFVQNLSYAKDLTSDAASGGLDMGATVLSEQEEYTISLIDLTPNGCDGLASGTACTGFTILAEATGSQTNDSECEDFTLTDTGVKGVTGSYTLTPRTCWK